MSSAFEKLARGQQHRPHAEGAPAAAAAAPPVPVDVRPLHDAVALLRSFSYVRQEGDKVWIEGKADRSTPIRELVERYGAGDGYLRGANRVLSAHLRGRDFASLSSCLSFADTGLALSEVAPRFKVGHASLNIPVDPGAFETTAPVGAIDMLLYDWQSRGYVPCSFESSARHSNEDPDSVFLSHAAIVRLHLAAFVLLRMFEDIKPTDARIAYLLFVGHLTTDDRLFAWRVDYSPKKYLGGEPARGRRAPLLRPEYLE